MSSVAPPFETIVNEVIVTSNYHEVTAAADLWRQAFRQVDGLRERLEHLSRTSAESWTGSGADAFRAHVKKQVDAVRATADEHRKVAGGLDACAGYLKEAFEAIRVPQWMYADVLEKQRTVLNGGRAAGFAPGAFLAHFELEYPEADLEAGKQFVQGLEQQAQQAYLALCERYRNALAEMPKGTRVATPAARPEGAKTTGANATAGPAQTPLPQSTTQLPPGTTTPTTPTPTPTAPNLDLPGVPGPSMPGLPGPDLPDPVDIDPVDMDPIDVKPVDVPDTGLAGVGGDLGGFGGGGGSGSGGVRVPSLGPPATLPESILAPVRDTVAAKGRIGASRTGDGPGGAVGPPMAPMLGGLSPAGAQQDAGETTTGLKEPSGMFAADDSIPPGVIIG